MLLIWVVSTPGGQKKVSMCLCFSLLYLVRVVNTPPLGVTPHHRITPAQPSVPTNHHRYV